MKLILASQSPYRKILLQNFGLPFEAHAPRVNEDLLKQEGPADLVELTRFLALRKAESLRDSFPNAVLIGSDQLASLGDHRLDKPGHKEKAIAQLQQLSGHSHRLITSLAVISPLKTAVATDITVLKMRRLTDEEIRAYVELDVPLDCAGSYKIEKAGLGLIEKVESEDPSAIQGLPMIALTRLLQELGLRLPDLWRNP